MRRWLPLLAFALGAPADASPPNPQQEARTVFDAWLAAQNGGDFAAYRALYDPAFTGVRRSGAKTVNLDRAGWLKDREAMFRKPMKVEASKVRIFTGQQMARVVFTQSWSSGNYSDVGPKHLLLRREKDGYRILREELFASIKHPPLAVEAAALARFAFVLGDAMVLSTQPDDGWAAGPPVRAPTRANDALVSVSRKVDLAKVPPELARLAGARVRVYNARGYLCEAKLGAFTLLSRVMENADITAEEVWDWGSHFLTARLVPEGQARCGGGTWARSAEQPPPTLAPAELPAPALAEQALAAFRKLAPAVAIQRRYASYRATRPSDDRGPADWTQVRDQPPQVRVVRFHRPTLVSVSLQVRLGDCGDGFHEQLWGLWEVRGAPERPRLVLANEPDPAMWLLPAGIVDSDDDGRPELLFESFTDDSAANAFGQPATLDRGVVRPLGGRYVDVDGLELRVLICPC